MNKSQRQIIMVGVVVAVAMLLFPPFQAKAFQGATTNLGYHFIATPPTWRGVAGTVNIALLSLQLFVLAVIGDALWLLLGERSMPSGAPAPAVIKQEAHEIAPEATDQSRSFLGGHYHPWRRYFARYIDYAIFLPILGLVLGAFFPTFASYIEQPGAEVFFLMGGSLAMAFVEALMISSTACTTPGKWLYGIRVAGAGGQPLPLDQSVSRALRVWAQGMGVGFPIASIVTMLFSYGRLTRTGSTAWDTASNATVEHRPLTVARAAVATIIIVASLALFGRTQNSESRHDTHATTGDGQAASPTKTAGTYSPRHFNGEERLLLGRPEKEFVTFEEFMSGKLPAENSAIAAYRRGDFDIALTQFLALAKQGSNVAEFYVGEMLLNGQGVAKDEANAFQWYLSAANHGDIRAATTVGVLYLKGVGVRQDIATGAEWLRRAADQKLGDGIAEYNLGVISEAGLFDPPDYANAYAWYKASAAEAGSDDVRLLAHQQMTRVLPNVGSNQAGGAATSNAASPGSALTTQPAVSHPLNKGRAARPCVYKPVMTDADYHACGLNPPAGPALR